MAADRERMLLEQAIGWFDLDLTGLVVLTEAASGPYLLTPLLAARAGAAHVFAVTRDSAFAAKEDVRAETLAASATLGVRDRVTVLFEKERETLSLADIVTNSGFVRPIDRATIELLKPTAVVPLMWETWEFRPADLDLEACRARGIPVLGTDESAGPFRLRDCGGFLAMKLLFELGLEGIGTRTLLVGGRGFAESAFRHLTRVGVPVDWFSATAAEARPFDELERVDAQDYDLLLVAEHEVDVPILGPSGLLDPAAVARDNPALRVGVLAGAVDEEALRASGLRYLPEELRPFGYESYRTSELGPLPVLALYAAGLKVGEAMARARLRGLHPEAAEREALARSPAMAFPEALRA